MENTVVINISGTKFEVSVNTFNNMMSTESDAKLKLEILKENNSSCYFLERNFGVFTAVLSYFQGNGLHVPALTCIAEFKKELDFWGIDPQEIEPCCYSKYIGFFDDQKALTILTDDQTERITERTELQRRVKATGWLSIQAKVWSVLEEPSFNMFAKGYFYISAFFVIVSIAALVCGTHPTFMRSLRESEWEEFFGEEYHQYSGHFDSSGSSTNTTLIPLPTHAKAPLDFLSYLDFITTTFFSVEFILRFIFCPNKKKFISSFLNLVDIFSLCVMYSKYIVEAINPREKYTATVFDIVHCFQIVRVFRLFRLVKNFIGFRVLLYALKASIWEVLLMSLFLVVAMLMFSAFVFFSGDTAFTSIPDAFWWAIVTMTTVGYGDMYPTQPLSKTIGAVCAVTGVCLLAIIIPIFVNNFLLFYAYSKVWGSKDNANTNKGGTKKNNIISSKSKVSPDC